MHIPGSRRVNKVALCSVSKVDISSPGGHFVFFILCHLVVQGFCISCWDDVGFHLLDSLSTSLPSIPLISQNNLWVLVRPSLSGSITQHICWLNGRLCASTTWLSAPYIIPACLRVGKKKKLDHNSLSTFRARTYCSTLHSLLLFSTNDLTVLLAMV